ncbi:MAG: cytochrome P450 [Rhodospirillaceae bacterium]|nr:cytochrome P450 [Rhodospirillaceae bacterium]MBT4042254.1 cytochrome P450 [Rhodospirillaceae bacterium]MBT4687373.1 cytochrome P450 [Rhodospirillaceae bacterium]MBT5079572.1 cytochrome P450 [Rhodospirillaceae bacterium]MBT5523844.1 cytochrome P450 [Rhodospirillaceae bacterium]
MDEQKPVGDLTTDFDILDPDYNLDPAPTWRDMRERCPIAHTEHWGGAWVATKYDDIQALVKKTPVLSNRQPTVFPLDDGKDPMADYFADLMPPLTKDPPEHSPLKRLLLPFFSMKAVEAHRSFTEQLCNELIDGFIENGACDAAEDYARQISPRVIGHLLGIEPGQSDQFVEWVQGFVELGASNFELRSKSYRALRGFLDDEIAKRREDPGDDYISRLIASELDGEPVPDITILNMCMLLLVAGVDTTWSSIGSSLLHFASHPNDRQRLVAEPELLGSAVEEMLRLHSPASAGRIAMDDVEHNGITFERGERLIMSLPSANRDPAIFENPDEADIGRERNRHVAFGVGIHRCVGSNLARLEMEVALKAWFARIPEFELSDPDAVTWSAGQVRGARTVPVKF